MNTTAIVDLVCAVFLCVLLARIISKKGEQKNKWELIYCVLSILILVDDALAYTLTGPEHPAFLEYILAFLSMHGAGIIILAYTFYTESLIRKKTEPDPRLFRILKIAELLWIAASVYESLSRHMIYFTDGVLTLDYSFPAYIDIAELVLLFTVPVYAMINRRKIGTEMAVLFSVFAFGPVLATVLFSFAEIDMSYPLGAFTFLLMDLFIQEQLVKEAYDRLNGAYHRIGQQQEHLEDALEAANFETKRNDILTGIIDGTKFTYDISADDRVVGAHYSELSIARIGEKYTETPMGWFELLHPEDKDRVYSAFMDSVHDHTGNTPYNETFRMMGTNGNYRWVRSGGNVIRRQDGSGEFFGISIDMTSQMEEQQRRLLGAMPLSNDVLAKANIGMWAFELDEGQPPRMYDDETMLGLVGLEHQVPPEEAYHAWYDNIDEGSYDLVTDAVNKMISGEHAEVQYPWHYPDGRTIIVRCGGVRNPEYTKGIRIEGTHQDVTQTLHFDEEERIRAKKTERDLVISQLRADSLAFIEDNEPDLDTALNFFGRRILEISGCDQVLFRGNSGYRLTLNAPGISGIPEDSCSGCPFSDIGNAVYDEDGTVLMNDCRLGCRGVMVNPGCPAKSSFMQRIHSGNELVGIMTVHYLNDYHTFTENGLEVMKTVAVYLGLLIGRIREKQAEKARIEAEASNRAKTEFLFNMSHDIRTPMNAILGYTDIALNHIDEKERVNDSLRKIKTSGGHLLSLINDILEMSRIEAGRMEIVNVPVNIYEATEGIVNMSQALAATKDITFSAEIGELKNPYIYSDELHTNQIIINLISNAIKYTNPGGKVDYRIEQTSDPDGGVAAYRVTVQDNGIGMSEEFQKHLFESFSREQTASVSKQEGAGLGLAIVKRIVDLSGGTIRCESRQGIGSTFTVELPLAVMDDAAVEAFEASRRSGAEITEDISLEGRKVLLVEDNEMNREIAAEILEETGLIVECAEDGALAVRKVMERGADHYDFILMDIQMPVMNGYEATAEIRKLPGGDKVPIIALSANAFKEDVEKSLAAGMNAHVAKPINVEELFGTLAGFM